MNVVIVHGCPSDEEKAMDSERRTYDKHWIPWIKSKLLEKGVETLVPVFPEPWRPVYEKYKEVFDSLDINEDSVLIGHSCGTCFITRYLQDTGKKVKKVIMVAPWLYSGGSSKVHEKFYDFQMKESVKSQIGEIIYFTSDNEEETGKKSLRDFHEVLGGKVVDLANHGHYCLRDMGTEEFSELLEEILA